MRTTLARSSQFLQMEVIGDDRQAMDRFIKDQVKNLSNQNTGS